MTFSFVRRAALSVLAILAALMVLVHGRLAKAEEGDPPEVEAHRLVHVLDYVSADYGGAVSGGAVVNADEYAEQLSLLLDASKIAARLATHAGAEDLPGLVEKVHALVEKKADGAAVATGAAEVRARASAVFKLVEAPTTPPDAARGAALFAEHCSSCHGARGDADTERAKTLSPRPANFLDPDIGEGMSPARVARTVRFGVNGTAMVPFTFLSDEDRWNVAFYAAGLRHTNAPSEGAPTYALAELAVRSDKALRADLLSAGITPDEVEGLIADLRRRAPYEDRASKDPLGYARGRLDRAKIALNQGDLDAVRGLLTDAYLSGIEPAEGRLSAIDTNLVPDLERAFLDARGKLAARAPAAETAAAIDVLLAHLTRAEALAMHAGAPSFAATTLWSAGLLLREGVEAALLVAALLGMAARAGLSDKKRFVHLGWISAVILGIFTWIASRSLIEISGASRELVEAVTALMATVVLFYVSYALLAKREVMRWLKFLREQVTPRRAAWSLFLVAFIAAYREAFETVLFYETLLAGGGSVGAALTGAGIGAAGLLVLVLVFGRAGRFTPPELFFRISGTLLYVLAVVFAGQGIAALQIIGTIPVHAAPLPSLPFLGIHATVETYAVQLGLVLAAVVGAVVGRRSEAASTTPPATASTSG